MIRLCLILRKIPKKISNITMVFPATPHLQMQSLIRPMYLTQNLPKRKIMKTCFRNKLNLNQLVKSISN